MGRNPGFSHPQTTTIFAARPSAGAKERPHTEPRRWETISAALLFVIFVPLCKDILWLRPEATLRGWRISRLKSRDCRVAGGDSQ